MTTPSLSADSSLGQRATPIAPWWHTIVLILFVVGFSVFEGLPRSLVRAANLPSRIPAYAMTLVVELALFAYVWLLALRPRKIPVREIIGGKWNSARDFFKDVAIVFVFWMIVIATLAVVRIFVHFNGLEAARALLPQTMAEMILFVVLAVTAGFCEEFVFRGYFQRQFHALTGNPAAAIALQAIVFGVGHLYQGWRGVIAITIYGALFGILAWNRKSLRPGMMQHAAQDALSGIAAAILIKNKMI